MQNPNVKFNMQLFPRLLILPDHPLLLQYPLREGHREPTNMGGGIPGAVICPKGGCLQLSAVRRRFVLSSDGLHGVCMSKARGNFQLHCPKVLIT